MPKRLRKKQELNLQTEVIENVWRNSRSIDSIASFLEEMAQDTTSSIKQLKEGILNVSEGVDNLSKKITAISSTDFLTHEDIQRIKQEITPKKGVDYSDGADGADADDLSIKADLMLYIDEKLKELNTKIEKKTIKAKDVVGIKDLLPKYPPMYGGGSGASFITSLRDVDLSGLSKNSNGKYILGSGSGSGGASTFLDLTDTPSAYDNAGGSVWKFLRVKTTNDGIEEVDISGGISLVKISNTDTTPQHLSNKLVVSSGSNPGLSILEASILNGGGNEDLQIQIDQTRIDHDQLLNFEEKEHIDWTVSQSPTYTIHADNYTQTTPGGANTQIQYNSSGSFAGDSGFTRTAEGELNISSGLAIGTGADPNTYGLDVQGTKNTRITVEDGVTDSIDYQFTADGFNIQATTDDSAVDLIKIKNASGTTKARWTSDGLIISALNDDNGTNILTLKDSADTTVWSASMAGSAGEVVITHTGTLIQTGDFTQTGKITRTTAQVVPSSSTISIGGQRAASFSGTGNVTGTTAVGNLFLTSWNDTDTLTSGGFGESMANFVMSATVENTGTVDKISNVLASFENNNSATVTDYTAFNAFGANGDAGSLGGSLTNAYAFRLPSGTWSNITGIKRGVSIEDATAENYMAGGLDLGASSSLSVNGTDILADSAGTMTLSNIDALDATTEATIEAAIDTLTLSSLTMTTAVTSIKDEDDMSSNDAGALATQQSIKAYVDDRSPKIITVYKASDETVNNSDTLQDDDDITFTIGANEIWTFNFCMLFSSSTTADIYIKWSVPSGCSVRYQQDDAAQAAFYETDNYALSSSVGSGFANIANFYGVIMNGGTAGSVTLQWAQSTAEATDTKVLTGTNLIATRLA